MKKLIKLLVVLLVLIPLCIYLGKFMWKFALFYALCGMYDIARNRDLKFSTIKRYFTGNGILTWLLSPFNIVMDLLCLPYVNKGIYKLEDLPPAYQSEIKEMIETAHNENLVGQLQERIAGQSRSMIFFKWYGQNRETFLDVPAFHQKYQYLQTIGISVFNKRASTSIHFGPVRATLRVLYNINNVEDEAAYIEVGDTISRWKDSKLFIFDDTLQHQSFNETDQPRYCMFVDIVRPSPFPGVLRGIVAGIRFFLKGANYIFYKNWKVLEK